jgi:hypothetical protein
MKMLDLLAMVIVNLMESDNPLQNFELLLLSPNYEQKYSNEEIHKTVHFQNILLVEK